MRASEGGGLRRDPDRPEPFPANRLRRPSLQAAIRRLRGQVAGNSRMRPKAFERNATR